MYAYDFTDITETYWGNSYDWSFGMEGYTLFRKDRQGWWGGSVVLSVNKHGALPHDWWGADLKVYRSGWKGRRAWTDDIIVQVCYRPLDKEDQYDEAFYSKTEWPEGSQALVLMGNFKQSSICWKDDTAWHRQSSRLLEHIDPFHLQVTDEPTRRRAVLDFVFTNKERVVENMKLKGSLGYSDHKAAKF